MSAKVEYRHRTITKGNFFEYLHIFIIGMNGNLKKEDPPHNL